MTKSLKTKNMKKFLLTLLVGMCCLAGHAQNKFNLSEVKSIVNFGIDYSLAKVYGGKDSGYQYWVTYADINELFISKSKTFDIGKRLGIPVEVVSLQAVNEVNKKINPDQILTRSYLYAFRNTDYRSSKETPDSFARREIWYCYGVPIHEQGR